MHFIRAQGWTVLCAFVVHLVFNRFEPRRATALLSLLFGVPFILGSSLRPFYNSIFASLLDTHVVFLGTLVSSVILYRVSPLHPLSRYPGPIFLKISRFASLWILLKGKQHQYYQQLHEIYGPYIRTGPNHIHISDVKAVHAILGSARFLKSDRYNAIKREGNAVSLLGISDPKEHSQRRRLWDRGLNTSALKGYQSSLDNRISQLIDALQHESTRNSDVDLTKWISFAALDFMGDLAWGGIFNSTREGKDVNGILGLSRLAAQVHEIAGTIPWIRPFYNYLPVPAKTIKHLQFARNVVTNRIARGSAAAPDLFTYLIGEYGTKNALDTPTLISEASFALVAGTDTVAVTMANTFFYLLSHPNDYERLKSEIDEVSSKSNLEPNILAGLPFLNAVLNETLRLQPAVPNGVQRVLIANDAGQGEIVNNRYIPPSTNLQVSTRCVHRDPAHFSPYPDEFWPERWLPGAQESLGGKLKYCLNEEAFFPFSYGPTNCAGKALALMEMRAMVAAIVMHFNLTFADGWDPKEWEKNLLDFFTLRVGAFPVTLVVSLNARNSNLSVIFTFVHTDSGQ